jgi:hypothetical protein
MIDFTGLLLPLVIVASLISGVAVTDPRSLYIDTITVPDSMEKRGYTPLVFIRMMNDEVQHSDDLEGDLGDVGLLAEPTMETTFWGRVRNTWQRLRGDERAAALP